MRGLKVHRLVVFFLQVVGDFFVELWGTFLGQPVVGGRKVTPTTGCGGKLWGTFLSEVHGVVGVQGDNWPLLWGTKKPPIGEL